MSTTKFEQELLNHLEPWIMEFYLMNQTPAIKDGTKGDLSLIVQISIATSLRRYVDEVEKRVSGADPLSH
jgi:hypothetical protein